MNRNIYATLKDWSHSLRRKPLVLQGARQVGKTFALQWFGKECYKETVYCNFEKDKKLAKLFTDSDPASIIRQIELYRRTDIKPKSTLIILDEIQECSAALNSLKYFQEELNEYHIVAAGSLLGVKLSQHESFPVGKVNFLHMYPLNFGEYLEACGEERLYKLLNEKEDFSPLNLALHERLIELLRRYMWIGGMPEAVAESIRARAKESVVREIQNELLKSYELDFVKHTSADLAVKLTQVWNQIPSQLAKENKKFIFSALRKSARGREFTGALQWLADAGLTYPTYALSKPNLPLAGYADRSVFKIYLIDVGLLGAFSGLEAEDLTAGPKIFSEFNGALTENYVAQQIFSSREKKELFYWRSENVAEVDFVESNKQRILPLEVKAGINPRSKSLKVFGKKYSVNPLYRTNLLNFHQSDSVINIPLYAMYRFPW